MFCIINKAELLKIWQLRNVNFCRHILATSNVKNNKSLRHHTNRTCKSGQPNLVLNVSKRHIHQEASHLENVRCNSSKHLLSKHHIHQEASHSEILRCDSSKHLLSVACRKTMDWNFNPDDLIPIFNRLVDIVYKTELKRLPWLFGEQHVATLQLVKGNHMHAEVYSQLEGPDLDQLIHSVNCNVDVLETKQLSELLFSFYSLGISFTEPAVTKIFERIIDERTSLSWIDLNFLIEVFNSYEKNHSFHVFIAKTIVPKFYNLVDNGGLDGSSKEMYLALTKILVKPYELAWQRTDVFIKCLKKISSLMLERDIYEDWHLTLSTVNFLRRVFRWKDMNNEVFQILRKVYNQTFSAVFDQIDHLPVYNYYQTLNFCYRSNIFFSNTNQVHMLIKKICKKSENYLMKENINVVDLCYVADIILRHSNSKEARWAVKNLISEHIKDADTFCLVKLLYLKDMWQPEKNFITRKVVKKLQEQVDEKIFSTTRVNSIPVMALINEVFTKHEHVDRSMNTQISQKLIKSYEMSYSKKQRFLKGISILNFCDYRNPPTSTIDEIMEAIPSVEPSFLRYLLHVFVHTPKFVDYNHARNYYAVRDQCFREVSKVLEMGVKEHKFTFYEVIKLVQKLYFDPNLYPKIDTTTVSLLIDEIYNLGRNMTLAYFNYFMTVTRMFYNEEFLDHLLKFALEFRADMNLLAIKRLLLYMYKVGYQVKDKDIENLHGLCADLLDNEFDNLPILDKLSVIKTLCTMEIYPEKQIAQIFSLNFLKEMDMYMNGIDQNSEWGRGVEKSLIVLNRALVIDCPHLNIPWIMESIGKVKNYQFYAQRHFENTSLFKSVEHVLDKVTGGIKYYKVNAALPYFYMADFEVLLDKDGNFLLYDEGENLPRQSIDRICILVQPEFCFCFMSQRLFGSHDTLRRHLQILGFRVVEIPYYEWYSMALSTTESKEQYLRKKIFNE